MSQKNSDGSWGLAKIFRKKSHPVDFLPLKKPLLEKIPMNLFELIHHTPWEALPVSVKRQAKRCLLDTVGTGLSARATPLSQIIHDHAAAIYAGKGAYLWQDGREVSPPGAALANGMTIDALDIHDGHSLTKGHSGAALVPALFATSEGGSPKVSGMECLTSLAIGYEVSIRAGMALHQTTQDYPTSGAWNALGCAALTARRLGLNPEQTRHALGIAEYHGPRSPMMRCIDHPTMLKDGSGWGAMSGVSAALLAQKGFTGAPAFIVEDESVQALWEDLGQNWEILNQYFKPHAVCRWAQPAVEGALQLQAQHAFPCHAVQQIHVTTFHEATRLNHPAPQTTEEAQYSLPFPVAAALVHGKLGMEELHGSALSHPEVLRLSHGVKLHEAPHFSAVFPAQRLAQVRIETHEGDAWESDIMAGHWEAENPPTDEELLEKFRRLVHPLFSQAQAESLENALWHLEEAEDLAQVSRLLNEPLSFEQLLPARKSP